MIDVAITTAVPASMQRSACWRALAAALAISVAWCIPFPGPEPPVTTRSWVVDRVFFGGKIPGGSEVSQDAWEGFLLGVVTPRFPEGLTVWRAEGQWTGSDGRLVHEPVWVLEIVHPDGPQAQASLAAIAREYKSRFRQDSVLRVSTSAHSISFE